MKLYIVRHGQTDANVKKYLLSTTDDKLNKMGYKQSLIVNKKLKNINFDICFSSKYKRTITTAKIIVEDKLPIIIDERLNERNFGLLEGSKDKRYTNDFWNYSLNTNKYEVEPLQNLFKRTKEFLKYLKDNYNDKTILIVSHAATIRVIHFNIVGFTDETEMLSFKVKNGQILEYKL